MESHPLNQLYHRYELKEIDRETVILEVLKFLVELHQMDIYGQIEETALLVDIQALFDQLGLEQPAVIRNPCPRLTGRGRSRSKKRRGSGSDQNKIQ